MNNNDSRLLAVITARGGSKRIPKKNINDFCGQPIIAYPIKAAIESNLFNEVMVSTDDPEIAEISLRLGAHVPFLRSAKTANDIAATHEVLREVIDEYKKLGEEYETVCCLYPTAPFITSKKLIDAFRIMKENGAQTVYPVVAFSFPPQRAVVIRDGYARFIHPEYQFIRSQDLETLYHDCGQFYFLDVESFLAQNKLILDRAVPIITSELEAQDIDNLDDWTIAEIKYRLAMGDK